MDSALNERCQCPAWLERKDRHRGKVGAGFAPRFRLLEADPLRGVPHEQEQDCDDVDHCLSPPSLGYFERAPPRSRAPQGAIGAGAGLSRSKSRNTALTKRTKAARTPPLGRTVPARSASTVMPPGYSSRRYRSKSGSLTRDLRVFAYWAITNSDDIMFYSVPVSVCATFTEGPGPFGVLSDT